MLKREGRIAGNCVEPPDQIAGLGVKGRDVTARVEFGAAIAN